VTNDDSPQGAGENSFYIPPTAGTGAKEQKKPKSPHDDDWSGLAILVFGMIILVAGFQLFFIVMQLINTWIADELVPVFTAAFDIAIIIGGILLIQRFIRKT
jgi:hypothetical protein